MIEKTMKNDNTCRPWKNPRNLPPRTPLQQLLEKEEEAGGRGRGRGVRGGRGRAGQ